MEAHLPIDSEDPVGTSSDRRYDSQYFLKQAAAGIFLGHVDIYEDNVHKCRIAVASELSHGASLDALEQKAKDWIAARRRADPEGATNFGDLRAKPDLHVQAAEPAEPS